MTIKEIVQRDIEQAEQDDYTSYLDDLLQHGCQSGMVNDLIYYHDTCKFYEEHKEEINAMVAELVEGCGTSLWDSFTNWDKSDPLALETNNQNLLAWFGYEEVARQLVHTN